MIMFKLVKLPVFHRIYCYKSLREFSSKVVCQRFHGKVAIVTASTEGIGFAIAKKLAQEGAEVVVSSRKQENVDEAVKLLNQEGLTKISGIVCHVGKKDDRQKLLHHAVTHFGGVDVLVSNAAVNPFIGPALQTPEESWDKIMQLNLKSAFQLTQEVVPLLKNRGGGSIVYISSLVGLIPRGIIGAYSISKTALIALTKVISNECSPMNIRVNCVAAGLINTKMGNMVKDVEHCQYYINELTDIKRIGEPDELGGTIAFLCSDDASYITGEVICVTGGAISRL